MDGDAAVPVSQPEPSGEESVGECELREESRRVKDVSGKSWQLTEFTGGGCGQEELGCSEEEGLFVYKNTYQLLPASIGKFSKLKTLKFFANEVEVLPPEAEELVELESVQIRVSSPRVSEVGFRRMKALKELELCKVPPRASSAFSILSEISNLKCLTKLTVSHYSIRYFPPEIASLKKLEQLDLSFNKLKNLPNCISELTSLKLLKISNNKLVDLPNEISDMKFLENLDLSNNRLVSVSMLKLRSMISLQYLNLQFNKISYSCQIPPWICCDMRGNNELTHKDERETSRRKNRTNYSSNGGLYIEAPVSLKLESAKRQTKTQWKRHEGPQQRAREERLNLSRNLKHEKSKEAEKSNDKQTEIETETKEELGREEMEEEKEVNMTEDEEEAQEEVINFDDLSKSQESKLSPKNKDPIFDEREEYSSKSDLTIDDSSCVMLQDSACSSDTSTDLTSKFKISKRHPDSDGDVNPKPSKVRRPPNPNPNPNSNPNHNSAYKYSVESFCGITDRLSDGFYDAGRDQPFLPLQDYENYLCLDSREIILLDREQDEELDSIVISAQLLLQSFNRPNYTSNSQEDESAELDNTILKASLLSLFVSDCFGGSDRSSSLLRTKRSVISLNKEQPFICTCTGNNNNNNSNGNLSGAEEMLNRSEGIFGNPNFPELCDKSLRFIKERRNSNVVPLGDLRFGVCRHRALLMKYLCDRMEPPIPCELVRGYLDFMPHAWNAILVKQRGFWVRMVVDPCYPTNIREETDPEYFCRYIPLSRLNIQSEKQNASVLGSSFPSLSTCREIDRSPARTLYHCKIGNVDAAIKVRYLDTRFATSEEIRNFEYRFLGEVRMLGALRNQRSIVNIFGHQLSCKWVPSSDANNNINSRSSSNSNNKEEEYRMLQSVIVMEYLKGGSLKGYLEKLSKKGEKHASINLALHIAREVSHALLLLHSKRIIHRDIKSENIVIDSVDFDSVEIDLSVKLVDFDQSVPVEARSHTCCIAHVGVWAPCCCVGTPRWMAPEVFEAMHKENQYGLEVDIWSYGCFLLELLTLQIPYQGLSDTEIYKHFHMREGPRLTKELEEFYSVDNHVTRLKLGISSDSEADKLKLLIKLFYQCIKGEPSDRPTAKQIYDSLSAI